MALVSTDFFDWPPGPLRRVVLAVPTERPEPEVLVARQAAFKLLDGEFDLCPWCAQESWCWKLEWEYSGDVEHAVPGSRPSRQARPSVQWFYANRGCTGAMRGHFRCHCCGYEERWERET
jgi:hypothetical protein